MLSKVGFLSQGAPQRRSGFIVLCLLAIGICAVYWQVVDFGYVNIDDSGYVSANDVVQRGLTLDGLKYAFRFSQANWHPLIWISLMIDGSIGGNSPAVYHVHNVILHAVAAMLLFILLDAMTGLLVPSALVAALFALHPLQVESVAWVTERKDVLGAVFWMLASLAYVRYARASNRLNYLLMLVVFALGLMSKQMLVTLPVVFLLMDYWPLNRIAGAGKQPGQKPLSGLVIEKLPLFALSVCAGIVAIYAQTLGGSMRAVEQYPMGIRLANFSVLYLGNLRKLALPTNLAFFYPHPGTTIPHWQVIVSAVAMIALSAVAVAARHKRPYVFVGWFWWIVVLLPMAGLLQSGEQASCDHHSYIAVIGIFLAAIWFVHELCRTRSMWVRALALAGGVLVVGAFGVMAHGQTATWKDTRSMTLHAMQVNPKNWLAHHLFAALLFDEGDTAGAIRHYEQALRANPKDTGSQDGMGAAYIARGDYAKAEQHYRAASRLEPDNAAVWYNLAAALNYQGRTSEAISAFAMATKADPDDMDIVLKYTGLLVRACRYDEAIRELTKALRKHPSDMQLENAYQEAVELRQGAQGR